MITVYATGAIDDGDYRETRGRIGRVPSYQDLYLACGGSTYAAEILAQGILHMRANLAAATSEVARMVQRSMVPHQPEFELDEIAKALFAEAFPQNAAG